MTEPPFLPRSLPRRIALMLLAISFVGVGITHFTNTAFFVSIVPPYLPAAHALVWVSGVCEILGGLGVLLPATRRLAGWGLIGLLIAVFPANIHMATHADQFADAGPRWALYVRLAFQVVFIAWVYWCTKPESSALELRT